MRREDYSEIYICIGCEGLTSSRGRSIGGRYSRDGDFVSVEYSWVEETSEDSEGRV